MNYYGNCNNTNPHWINLTQPCNPCASCNRCACDCTCNLPDYCQGGCLTMQPTDCMYWGGNAYTGLGIAAKANLTSVLNIVLGILDTQNTDDSTYHTQVNTKLANVLIALNDLNTRINTLAGGTPHAAYTI